MKQAAWLAAMVAVALAIGGGAQAAAPTAITIGHDAVGTLDPTLVAVTGDQLDIAQQMFAGLTKWDVRTRQLDLQLAKSYDVSPDLKTWTYKLQSAKWSDGTPITAGDEVFAVARAQDPALTGDTANFFRDLIASVTALDKKTVQFQLKRPAAFFPAVLTNPAMWPLPQQVVTADGAAWTDPANIVVSGAYTLASRTASSIVLQSNPRYFGKTSIDTVTYALGDPSTFADAYAAGQLDYFAAGFNTPGLAEIEADPRLTPDLVTSFGALTELLVFNPVVGSTTNVDVRRALSAATDRARIAGAALGDASFAATTFTAPPIFGAVPPSAGIGIGFDPAAALADRDAAGAAFPSSVTIRYSQGNTRRQREAAILKEDWERIFGPGFTVNLDPEPASIAIGSLFNPDPNAQADVTMVAWSPDYPDADDAVNGGTRNVQTRWSNPQFDAVTADAAATLDPAVRQADYANAERIVTETDAVVAPVYYSADAYVHKPFLDVVGSRIEDWTVTP